MVPRSARYSLMRCARRIPVLHDLPAAKPASLPHNDEETPP
ncbi:MAG: hypothetical protein ABI920_11460 [Casimicrobiaceae bacterium]